MNRLSRTIALIAMVSIPALASAEVKVSNVTAGAVKISYSSEDLLNEYGRSELEQQIRQAADRVCGPRQLRSAVSLERMMNNRNCYSKAVEDAMRSISSI